jgi:L-aspartate oxidase
MQAVHPDAELAPRDVVARGIAMQMAAQGGRPVLLDATHLGEQFLAQRFPSIDAACRSRGLNWAREPIPVSPAAHYWMGGVRTDLWGRTSIPGLFAIGEVACTGAHGANRLASNSLLESLVFAWRCADFLLEGKSTDPRHRHPSNVPQDLHEIPESSASSDSIILSDRSDLQRLMWNKVGIERNSRGLREAIARLARWRVNGFDVHSRETTNLLQLARATANAALEREESRGAHFRTDYPEASITWGHSLTYAQRVPVTC